MGIKAKRSVAARNTVLLLGFAVLVAGNLLYAFNHSEMGEGGSIQPLLEAHAWDGMAGGTHAFGEPPLVGSCRALPALARARPPASACTAAGVALGCACVGVHMAMTQVCDVPGVAYGAGASQEQARCTSLPPACWRGRCCQRGAASAGFRSCLHPPPSTAAQGVLFGMIASVVPSQPLPGLGRVSGTVWAITDLALGAPCCCGVFAVAPSVRLLFSPAVSRQCGPVH